MTDALLLRPVPQRRHPLAERALVARRAVLPAGPQLTTWWELVDPAAADDADALGLVATRHGADGVIVIADLVVPATATTVEAPADGADDVAVRLLRSLVDALRTGTTARMLLAPHPVPGGLHPRLLAGAGFVPARADAPAAGRGATEGGYVVPL